MLALAASCNGFFVDPTLTSLAVTPTSASLIQGNTQQLTATGTYDGPKFRRLQLKVSCDAPAEQVERLLEPALRVCYVSNTIALSPPIEVALGQL